MKCVNVGFQTDGLQGTLLCKHVSKLMEAQSQCKALANVASNRMHDKRKPLGIIVVSPLVLAP